MAVGASEENELAMVERIAILLGVRMKDIPCDYNRCCVGDGAALNRYTTCLRAGEPKDISQGASCMFLDKC